MVVAWSNCSQIEVEFVVVTTAWPNGYGGVVASMERQGVELEWEFDFWTHHFIVKELETAQGLFGKKEIKESRREKIDA